MYKSHSVSLKKSSHKKLRQCFRWTRYSGRPWGTKTWPLRRSDVAL